MDLWSRATSWFVGLRARMGTYSPWEVAVELLLIWIVVYLTLRFVRGTRAAGALKGLLVLVAVIAVLSRLLGGEGSFQRLSIIYDRALALVAIGLIVIFQPELRRGLVRLGETSVLRGTRKDVRQAVEEIVDATRYLSRSRFGALIAIERQSRLGTLLEGGTRLNADLSSQLLQTIFFPGGALHDLACVVRGRTIEAAGVQLPLADPDDMPSKQLGSRHRAAVGLTQDCDAVVVVVSEESGSVRIAERGKLTDPLTSEQLESRLLSLLKTTPIGTRGRANASEASMLGSTGFGESLHDSGQPAGLKGMDDTGLAAVSGESSSALPSLPISNDATGDASANESGKGAGESRKGKTA